MNISNRIILALSEAKNKEVFGALFFVVMSLVPLVIYLFDLFHLLSVRGLLLFKISVIVCPIFLVFMAFSLFRRWDSLARNRLKDRNCGDRVD